MTDEQPPPPPECAPAPPLAPAPEPERYPFWGYSDLFLFVGLLIPSVLVSSALLRVLFAIFGVHPAAVSVLVVLPEQLLSYALIFGSLALILRLQYDRSFWRSLAWTPSRLPFGLVMICGIGCALAVAYLGSLIQAPTKANPMTELMQGRTSMILMAIFGTTIAPISEELVFRGFLQPLLVRTFGAVAGILIASLPFGFLHFREYGNSWRHAVLIALAGTCFGWMRQVTGSTRASSLMHAAYNGMIFLAVLVGQGLHR